MNEAKTLAQFKHPNIVRVLTVFPANNTAYMVMEYEQGDGMHQLLKETKTVPEAELRNLILPILDGLKKVHEAGFIHRDIKPPNIFIRSNGSSVLLDFGSARQALGQQTRTLTTLVSQGYAPFEQYVGKGEKQGPWTDIYGMGATLYRCVTGKSPGDAMNRSEALLQTNRDIYVSAMEIRPQGYSESLLAAIDHALAFKAEDRPQSVAAWLEEFAGVPTVVASAGDAAPPLVIKTSTAMKSGTEQPQTRPRHKWLKRTGGLILVVLATLVVAGYLKNHSGKRAAPADAAVTSAAPATVDLPPQGAAPIVRDAVNDINQGGETTTDKQPPVITDRERRRLAFLQRRLQNNPNDKTAREQLKTIISNYEDRVKAAVRNKDYALAESYINEMLELAPDNKKLQEARQIIRQRNQ